MKYLFLLLLSFNLYAAAIQNTEYSGILYAEDNVTESQDLNNPAAVHSQKLPLDYVTHYSITAIVTSATSTAGIFLLEASNDCVEYDQISSSSITGDGSTLFNISNAGYRCSRLSYSGTATGGTYKAKFTRKFFRN